eukprot:CAMPEP_0197443518 /NCGR_PEP_ID=MMETSP1175-20131217/9241_1 /TAXON_ID=1003142 /ORGANISM="Triceratium dubium, Strain CCMP147" /LENGTH=206 /DNA_ID=CAMNT_0042974159 /DNA_START=75 /DNA_END=695 /DNA_ORIENTATION=+
MVRKARNKKRRAGRIGKVKLKTSAYSKYKPPQIRDNAVRSQWDPTKTARINLSSMGLASTVNEKVSRRNIGSTLPKGVDGSALSEEGKKNGRERAVELFDIPESDDVGGGITKIKKRTRADVMLPLSVEDQEYVARCMGRHGTDYRAMARDVKINDMQHTEGKLRKMGARFLLLEGTQRRAEVPENVRHLTAAAGRPEGCGDNGNA